MWHAFSAVTTGQEQRMESLVYRVLWVQLSYRMWAWKRFRSLTATHHHRWLNSRREQLNDDYSSGRDVTVMLVNQQVAVLKAGRLRPIGVTLTGYRPFRKWSVRRLCWALTRQNLYLDNEPTARPESRGKRLAWNVLAF